MVKILLEKRDGSTGPSEFELLGEPLCLVQRGLVLTPFSTDLAQWQACEPVDDDHGNALLSAGFGSLLGRLLPYNVVCSWLGIKPANGTAQSRSYGIPLYYGGMSIGRWCRAVDVAGCILNRDRLSLHKVCTALGMSVEEYLAVGFVKRQPVLAAVGVKNDTKIDTELETSEVDLESAFD